MRGVEVLGAAFFGAQATDVAFSFIALKGLHLWEANLFATALFGHLGIEQTMGLKIFIGIIVPAVATLRAQQSETLQRYWYKALHHSGAVAWGFTTMTIASTFFHAI